MTPKCGGIVIWHWSHRADHTECDDWHAVETEWHREWKSLFPLDSQEVVLEKRSKKHRADVLLHRELVIEFQHSPITIADVKARESFYGRRMVWVFNCRDAFKDGRLTLSDHGEYKTFRWTHPKRTPQRCERPTFFDLGGAGVLDVRKLHGDTRIGGWGYLRTKADFVNAMTLANPRGWMEMLYRGPEAFIDPFDAAKDLDSPQWAPGLP
jgi:hypothetical protein